MKTHIRQMRCTGDDVGTILSVGRLGGAYCQHYMVESVDGAEVNLVAVRSRSEQIPGETGYYRTVWTRLDTGARVGAVL